MHNLFWIIIAAVSIFAIQTSVAYIRKQRLKRWFAHGVTAMKNQQYTECLKAFKKCIGICPESIQLRAFVAMSLAHLGRTTEALKEINMVQNMQPKSPETWMLKASFYLLCLPNDEEGLFDALEKLAELDSATARKWVELPVMKKYTNSLRMAALRSQLDPPSVV